MKRVGRVLSLLFILVIGSSSFSHFSIANSQVEAATSSYQTTSNVNLRSGAGTNYKKIITIPKGMAVSVSSNKGKWYKVSYSYKSNGKSVKKTGWVMGSYIKKVKNNSVSEKFSKTSFKTKASLNLRTGAGTKYKTLLTIPKGKAVTSKQKKGNWYKVTYTYKSKGKTVSKSGWVSGSYLKEYYQYIKTNKTYYFTKKSTKVYASPDTKKGAVQTLKKGNGIYSKQKVINSKGETWYKTYINGKKLYIKSNGVKLQSFKSTTHSNYQTIADTTMYKSYGNAYMKLVIIPKGTVITSKSRIGNWYKATFNGKNGYVHTSKIREYTESTKEEEKTDSTQGDSDTIYSEEEIDKTTFLANNNLEVKETASYSSKNIVTIPKGKIVAASHKTSNGWYRVSYAGKHGYVEEYTIQQVNTGDPLTHRDGYQFIDLRTKSPVTAAQIDKYISNFVQQKKSVLSNKGKKFIEVGNKYGVNALYLAAHAIHESAYGTSELSIGKYNLFGFAAYDSTPFIAAYRFSDVDTSIEYIAREIKATYLNPLNWKYNGAYLGFSTKTLGNTRINSNSEGMNYYYASDPLWGVKIANHMEKILPYNKTYYLNATANKTVPSIPGIPTGKEVFPSGIEGVIKGKIKLYTDKGNSTPVKEMDKNTSFQLLEKHNDFWVKISVGKNTYWTNSIKFDVYRNFISIKNLGRVTAASLNVRPEPSTSKEEIAKLSLNQYVHILLDKDKNIITDSTKKWYKVKLANGQLGWVSAQYIKRELN